MKMLRHATCSVLSALGMALCFAASALEKCDVALEAGWIECEGEGRTEDQALDKALKQGVSMVFGVELDAADKMFSASDVKGLQTPAGDVHLEMSRESMESQMMKKTKGRVRAFSIVWVKPNAKDENVLRAHVHANIVNPRAGLDGVILVTPPQADVDTQRKLFDVGPHKRMTGVELCEATEKALCAALSYSKHYRTVTLKDLKSTAANTKLSEEMTRNGLAPSAELLEAGKMLTADYVLSLRLKDFVYSRKMGRDKKTRKLGSIYTMRAVFDVHLTNVRLGAMAGSDTLTLTLDSNTIKALVDENEEADLLATLFYQMTKPLRGWIKANAK